MADEKSPGQILETLLGDLSGNAGIPEDWVRKELDFVVTSAGFKSDKNLTIEELREAVVQYLQNFADIAEINKLQ